LLRRGPNINRVAAQERGQHAGGNSQVDASHLFADAVHVKGASAHSTESFRNEQELNAQLGAAHTPYDLDRTFVAFIPGDELLVRKPVLSEFLDGFQAQFQGGFIEPCDGSSHDVPFLSRVETWLECVTGLLITLWRNQGLQLVQLGLQIAAASIATTGIAARPLHAHETEAEVVRRLGAAGWAQSLEGIQCLEGNLSLIRDQLCL
jgi:hypothetical protein